MQNLVLLQNFPPPACTPSLTGLEDNAVSNMVLTMPGKGLMTVSVTKEDLMALSVDLEQHMADLLKDQLIPILAKLADLS